MGYDGVLCCHENTCYVIFIDAFFESYIVLVQSMRVSILRSIGTKLTSLENLTSHEVSTTSSSKVMAQTVIL